MHKLWDEVRTGSSVISFLYTVLQGLGLPKNSQKHSQSNRNSIHKAFLSYEEQKVPSHNLASACTNYGMRSVKFELWESFERVVGELWGSCERVVGELSKTAVGESCGRAVEQLRIDSLKTGREREAGRKRKGSLWDSCGKAQ